MKIQIDEHWTVEADTASWNLEYREEGEINPKTGKPTVSSEVSYHARLVDALKAYLNKAPKDATTANEIIEAWDKAVDRVENACKGITKQKVG